MCHVRWSDYNPFPWDWVELVFINNRERKATSVFGTAAMVLIRVSVAVDCKIILTVTTFTYGNQMQWNVSVSLAESPKVTHKVIRLSNANIFSSVHTGSIFQRPPLLSSVFLEHSSKSFVSSSPSTADWKSMKFQDKVVERTESWRSLSNASGLLLMARCMWSGRRQALQRDGSKVLAWNFRQ